MKLLKGMGRRFAAMASYGYQAIAALALVLLVGRFLKNAEYAHFSLTMATAQFAAIGAFEWVRLAATRFYPGPTPEEAPKQLASLAGAFAISMLIGAVAAALALLSGISADVALIGALLAISQGATDLQLTLARFRGDLNLFSRGQSIRASLLLAGGITGATFTHTAIGALVGVLIGYLIALFIAVVCDRPLRETPWREASKALILAQVKYGAPAAAASVLHLGAALTARYVITLITPGVAGASALMAFDLMQRPFSVVTAALHGVLYPPVVAAYDKGGFPHAGPLLKRLYVIETSCITVLGIGIVATILWPQSISIIAPPAFRSSFAMPALLAAILFALRAVLINLAPLAAHLAKRVPLIMATAACDITLMSAFLASTFAIGHGNAPAMIAAFSASSALTIAFGWRVTVRLFSEDPKTRTAP